MTAMQKEQVLASPATEDVIARAIKLIKGADDAAFQEGGGLDECQCAELLREMADTESTQHAVQALHVAAHVLDLFSDTPVGDGCLSEPEVCEILEALPSYLDGKHGLVNGIIGWQLRYVGTDGSDNYLTTYTAQSRDDLISASWVLYRTIYGARLPSEQDALAGQGTPHPTDPTLIDEDGNQISFEMKLENQKEWLRYHVDHRYKSAGDTLRVLQRMRDYGQWERDEAKAAVATLSEKLALAEGRESTLIGGIKKLVSALDAMGLETPDMKQAKAEALALQMPAQSADIPLKAEATPSVARPSSSLKKA